MKHCSTALLLVLCAVVTYGNAQNRKCYGSITGLNPTGKSVGGVSASENRVRSDLRNLQKYRDCFNQAANSNYTRAYCPLFVKTMAKVMVNYEVKQILSPGIEASLIAALASRESNGGATLKAGYGDGGKAWGILQCDSKASKLNCKRCGWDSCCHVDMMVKEKLVIDIKAVAKKHPGWTKNQVLQGAVAAYNFGVKNVKSWARLDIGSTQNDYSNDIMARAKYLYSQGWN